MAYKDGNKVTVGTGTWYTRLTVTEKSSTATAATYTCTLQVYSNYGLDVNYNSAHIYAGSSSGGTQYGSWSSSGDVSIYFGYAGSGSPATVKTWEVTIAKGKSAKTAYFQGSFYLCAVLAGTSTANVSVTVPAMTSYAVAYNANGGSGAPSAQTKWYGESLTLSSTKPTRTGYTFKGWATSSGGSVAYASGASYTANAALTLYAVWQVNTWTVSYNANGGSGAPSSQTKTYGQTLTLSSTKPTRTGYTFQGWATSASGSVAYAAGGSYTANSGATLYAVWQINTWTVKFDANGGSGAPAAVIKTYGVTLTLPTTQPYRTNYNFKGWATSSTGGVAYSAGGSYTANSGATLYAVWELAYVAPIISGLSANRCDSAGTANDYGAYAKVSFYFECCQLIGDNPAASVKVTCNGTTTAVTPSNLYAGSVGVVVGGALDVDTAYTITVSVTDTIKSTTVTASATLTAAVFPIDFKSGGRGVAIGKPAANDGFEVAMDATFEGDATVDGVIKMSTWGQSWIGGKTIGNMPLSVTKQQNSSSYFPVLGVKTNSGHVVNLGGLGDRFGFYGFYSSRTANGTDWSATINAADGSFNLTKPLSVGSGGTGVTTDAAIGLKAYPVGSVYIAYNSTSPASRFGGTWTAITGRFPYFNAGKSTGGSNTHTLTVAQTPSHNHAMTNLVAGTGGISSSGATLQVGYYGSWGANLAVGDYASNYAIGYTGGGGSHNNMPAYQTLYAWRRTA